jgi:hypothetical protein
MSSTINELDGHDMVEFFRQKGYPELALLAKQDPFWFIAYVDTAEASALIGVPVPTLETLRSRGGGPKFSNPPGSRSVRYMRFELYRWLLSTPQRRNTGE